MKAVLVSEYKSPAGELILGSFEDRLCLCDWKYRKMRNEIDSRIKARLHAEYREGETGVTDNCKNQLEEYFSGQRKAFDLPLELAGSDFQKEVWAVLQTVSWGETVSYKELSELMGNPAAIRAVAAANGANAISIIVPCHRIIGSDGGLVGYAGGLRAKQMLLDIEAPGPKQFTLF